MGKIQSWEVSDAFWEKAKPFVPKPSRNPGKQYKRCSGGGRKPLPPWQVFEGIVYELRTGCQWKVLPKERFGCGSAIHRYLLEWAQAGSFYALWKAGLTDYDELKGIAWDWQSMDGAMTKALLALVGSPPLQSSTLQGGSSEGQQPSFAPHQAGQMPNRAVNSSRCSPLPIMRSSLSGSMTAFAGGLVTTSPPF